jgi:hypothetical protein
MCGNITTNPFVQLIYAISKEENIKYMLSLKKKKQNSTG